MAAAANLTIVNGLAANVTYYPFRIVNGSEAVYVDRTNTAIAAQSRGSVFISETATTRKVTGKLTLPVLNATTGALSHTPLGTFDMRLPLVSTAAERLDVYKRLHSLLGNAITQAMAVDGESPW
jgi:hypothetical protein